RPNRFFQQAGRVSRGLLQVCDERRSMGGPAVLSLRPRCPRRRKMGAMRAAILSSAPAGGYASQGSVKRLSYRPGSQADGEDAVVPRRGRIAVVDRGKTSPPDRYSRLQRARREELVCRGE